MSTNFDPRLIRFLARHAATGAVAGLVALLGMVWTGVAGLDGLMDRSDVGWVAYLMLAVAFATTGAAVGMGVAVMALGKGR
jgi:hypothetical protein